MGWFRTAFPRMYNSFVRELDSQAGMKAAQLNARNVVDRPALRRLLGLTAGYAIDRSRVPSRLKLGTLAKYSRSLDTARRFGPLMKQMPVTRDVMFRDEVEVMHPLTGHTQRFPIDALDELVSTLPYDGRPVPVTYRMASSRRTGRTDAKWRVQPVTLEAPQAFAGLKQYRRTRKPPRLPARLRARLAPGQKVATWRLLDGVSHRELASGRLGKTGRIPTALGGVHLHGDRVIVSLTTKNETIDYPFRAPSTAGQMRQKLIGVEGAEARLKLRLAGPSTKGWPGNVRVELRDPGNNRLSLSQKVAVQRRRGAVTLEVRVPLDVVDSMATRLVLKSGRDRPDVQSTLDTAALRDAVPTLGMVQVRTLRLADREWRVAPKGPGKYLVGFEISNDGRKWRRVATKLGTRDRPAVAGRGEAKGKYARAVVRRIGVRR